jgi:PIN domain nuclease of toxin-antitoxin system
VIVVDTHAVIWLTQERTQLSDVAESALIAARQTGDLAIADITLQEIARAVVRGRVSVSSPLEIYLAFVESLFRVLPINGKIAERSMQFGKNYPKDPADRLIGATTLVYGAKLITKDGPIRDSGEVPCIW